MGLVDSQDELRVDTKEKQMPLAARGVSGLRGV